MDEKLLPFMYAALVFSVVAFLFILLGRIFLNIDTIYFYDFDIVTTVNPDYLIEIQDAIKRRGEKGWKFEHKEEVRTKGAEAYLIMLVFVKTKNKIKFF